MTTATESTTATVAEELVSFCRAGRNLDAINTLYSPDVVSIESMGNETMPREQKGIDAIRGESQRWRENNGSPSAGVDGPFLPNDDKCPVHFNFDCTFKPTGKRSNM